MDSHFTECIVKQAAPACQRLREWQIEQVRRIGIAHRLNEEQLVLVLGADQDDSSRLALFINVVTRLEVRLHHDPKLVRGWLTSPQPSLSHRVPLDLIDEIDSLQMLREAVASIAVDRPRMWRVARL